MGSVFGSHSEFMLGDRHYCYPLTITDFASRYLLTCGALTTTQKTFAFTVFEETFKEFGLRSDHPEEARFVVNQMNRTAHAVGGKRKTTSRTRSRSPT